MLPSFLSCIAQHDLFSDALFKHNAHIQWWPSSSGTPKDIMLFLPGNPGLLGFYNPYFTSLHAKQEHLAICAHSYFGHTPNLPAHSKSKDKATQLTLDFQVEMILSAYDAIRFEFPKSRIVITAHSVGSWIALKVLKARSQDSAHLRLFLLCPTITHIKDTPNGRRLSWIFQSYCPLLVSKLNVFCRLLPLTLIGTLFWSWPRQQVKVLQELVTSGPSILACLTMADSEMKIILDLDATLLTAHQPIIHMVLPKEDAWVGKTNRDNILRCFPEQTDSGRLQLGLQVPHAFCINDSEILAEQCSQWLDSASSTVVMK